MSKKIMGWAALCVGVSAAAPTLAQEVKASADVSSEGASATTTSSGSTDEPKYEPYEPGYPPDGNVLEIGVFAGMLFPSKDHNIRDEKYDHRAYKNAPEFGGRIGYYPLSFLGIEGEGMLSLSRIKADDSKVVLYSGRGQLVLQIPTGYVTPFAAGGVGKLAAISDNQGKDSDTAWHFGVGAKVQLTNILALRIDGRDNLTAHWETEGQAHTFEALIGLSATIERARKPLPPPPADTDHDGVVDRDDKCPADPGAAPSGCPADTDNDLVLDRDDYCPREPGPAPKGCPELDMDKDGVLLPCDACPDEVGVKPDGCPIRDTDKDGIFDDKDKCPKEAETKNGFEDSDGCPDKIPDSFKKFTGVVQGIFFDQGKATVRKNSAATLDGAVKVLQDYPSVRLEISGHTSSEGDKAVNAKLSQERADAVKTWIVGKGVDPNRIVTRGAGADEPIADNKTQLGKSKNRRIEFKILQDQPAAPIK